MGLRMTMPTLKAAPCIELIDLVSAFLESVFLLSPSLHLASSLSHRHIYNVLAKLAYDTLQVFEQKKMFVVDSALYLNAVAPPTTTLTTSLPSLLLQGICEEELKQIVSHCLVILAHCMLHDDCAKLNAFFLFICQCQVNFMIKGLKYSSTSFFFSLIVDCFHQPHMA